MNHEMLWFLTIFFFLNLLRSHSRDRAHFPSYNEKSAVGWIQSIL